MARRGIKAVRALMGKFSKYRLRIYGECTRIRFVNAGPEPLKESSFRLQLEPNQAVNGTLAHWLG